MAVADAKAHLAQLESRFWQRLERNKDNEEYMGCLEYDAGVCGHVNVISTPAIDALLIQSRNDPHFWDEDSVSSGGSEGGEDGEEEEEGMPFHFVVAHQASEAARRRKREGREGGRELEGLKYVGPPVRDFSSSSSSSSSSYSSSCCTTSSDSYSTSASSSYYSEMEMRCADPCYLLPSISSSSSSSSSSSRSSSSSSNGSNKRRRLALHSASSTNVEEEEEEEWEKGGRKRTESLTSAEEATFYYQQCWQGEMDVSGEEEEEEAGGALLHVVSQIRKSGSHQDLVDFVCEVNLKGEEGGEGGRIVGGARMWVEC